MQPNRHFAVLVAVPLILIFLGITSASGDQSSGVDGFLKAGAAGNPDMGNVHPVLIPAMYSATETQSALVLAASGEAAPRATTKNLTETGPDALWDERDGWRRSKSGTLYRAATNEERSANQWPDGTVLIQDVIHKAIAGGKTVEDLLRLNKNTLTVEIPRSDTKVVKVIFDLVGGVQGLTLHDFRFDGELFDSRSAVRTFRRMFYRLITTDHAGKGRRNRNDLQGRLSIDGKGNYYAKISFEGDRGEHIKTATSTFQLLGPEAGNLITPIPAPDGTIPGPDDLATIFPSEATHNPADDLVLPPPANPLQLALFGNMMWCQQHLNNWPVLIFDTHHEIILGFRSSEEDTGVDIVVDGTAWCMLYDPDPADHAAARMEAKWCEWGQRDAGNETCAAQAPCLDGLGLAYPFTGNYRNSGKYVEDVWENGGGVPGGVEYADARLNLPDMMLAQVLVLGGMIANADAPCPADDGQVTLCGQAGTVDPGGSVSFGRPSADYDPITDGCGFTSAHELGHNLIQFAGHEVLQNDMGDQNCDGYETIMFGSDANGGPAPPDACRVNWFSSDNADTIKDCVADNTNACPRDGPYVDQLP